MLLGVLPSEALLRQYSLPEYLDVREALRQGDAGLLARTMDARQAQFIQAGADERWPAGLILLFASGMAPLCVGLSCTRPLAAAPPPFEAAGPRCRSMPFV